MLTSVTAFFPCYNDAGSIEWVVDRAVAAFERAGVACDVVVVNDGSADESARVLASIAERLPFFRVVTHEANRGYGGALRSGFAAATGDWVFYTDGDGQYDPDDIDRLLKVWTDEIDVVQGFKLNRGDGLARRVLGRAYHRLVATLFGLPIRDTDADFRLMRRTVLDRCELTSSTGAICVELVWRLHDAGARFVEVGIPHHPRRAGRSKFLRPVPVARTMLDLLRLWVDLVLRRK